MGWLVAMVLYVLGARAWYKAAWLSQEMSSLVGDDRQLPIRLAALFWPLMAALTLAMDMRDSAKSLTRKREVG